MTKHLGVVDICSVCKTIPRRVLDSGIACGLLHVDSCGMEHNQKDQTRYSNVTTGGVFFKFGEFQNNMNFEQKRKRFM